MNNYISDSDKLDTIYTCKTRIYIDCSDDNIRYRRPQLMDHSFLTC